MRNSTDTQILPKALAQPSLIPRRVSDRLPILGRFRIGGMVSHMRTLARRVVVSAPDSAIENLQSPADVMEEVVEQTEGGMRTRTLRVLRESKPRWSQESRIAVTDAVDFGDFGEIGNDTPELKMAAVALRVIAESVRNGEGCERLRQLEADKLEAIGMSYAMQRLLVGECGNKNEVDRSQRRGLLQKLRAADMEHLRQHGRGLHGEDLKAWSHDAVRERRRLFNAFHSFASAIEDDDKIPEFKDEVLKEQFVTCMRLVAESYRTHNRNRNVPSNQQCDAAENALVALDRFYRSHPDFPLTIIPPGCGYLCAEFGEDLGYDSGVMVAWRDKRDAAQEEVLMKLRSPLVDVLLAMFPHELLHSHLQNILRAQAFVRSDVISTGAGRTMRSFAEEHAENGFLLLKNIQEGEETEPCRDTLKFLLPSKFHAIVDSAGFAELVRTFTVLHEFIHRVFPAKEKAAKALGKGGKEISMDDELAECKSDNVAMAVFTKLYGDHAKELFGDDAQAAMNLALMGAMANALCWSNADSETSPYFTSAVLAYGLFEKAGLIKMQKGKVVIDPQKIAELDVAEVVEPLAREILGIYRSAQDGEKGARSRAKKLAEVRPSTMVKKLKNQL